MRKVLVVLLILVIGGLIAADRLGVNKAEDEIGKQVSAQYALKQEPKVTIHGFPFLTQAVGGQYDRIDVSLGDWTEEGITVTDVKVELRDIKAPLSDVINGDGSQIIAGTATASAIVPFQVVKQRAPQNVKEIAANGSDLQVTGTYTYLGITRDLTAIVSLKATPQGIVVTPQSVGDKSAQVPLALIQRGLSWTIPVQNLPIGSRISKIEVTPDGLRVSATANNVNFDNLPRS